MPNAVLLPLVTFVAAASVLTITPGMDTVMVLRSSTSAGPRAGAAAGLGICSGLLVWGAGCAFGLTALLSASEIAFTAVKWAGAVYLLYLGTSLLVPPRTEPAPVSPTAAEPQDRDALTDALRRGFLSNILNPKIGIFYITFLPQFIPHGANVAAFSLLLTSVHVALSLIWFFLLIALTVPLGVFLAKPRVVRALDRLTGCVFVAFGTKLAIARRA